MPAKKTVYDLDTGKAIERFAIVADELVATDPKRFSFEPPAKKADDDDDKHKGKSKSK